ncbi:MAG: hypothetical protein PHC62_06410 [Candidatus Izemoplasmatales bacterium]|jgi:hypothetical protein|nr:hypothetical protein [Candidatus Izemoplasmatales bacterium]
MRIISNWKEEFDNYIQPIHEDENDKYLSQEIELDAIEYTQKTFSTLL